MLMDYIECEVCVFGFFELKFEIGNMFYEVYRLYYCLGFEFCVVFGNYVESLVLFFMCKSF